MSLKRELWQRECKSNYVAWCTHALSDVGQRPAMHHQLLCNRIQALIDGPAGGRLMIFAPPGSAKTTYTARLSPPWIMQYKPGWSIIGASHKATFAEENSGYAINYIKEYGDFLGIKLRSEAVQRWRTVAQRDETGRMIAKSGDYLAAGVDAGISGFRADLAIIDDPIKGRKAADSEVERKHLWKWYFGDLTRRLKPEGRVILMHTRWHPDDLAGQLLEAQRERWEVLCMPALADTPDDPLGREIGVPLWLGDSYGFGEGLTAIRDELTAAGASMEWSALYQQKPRPAEGNLFKVDNIKTVTAVPHGTSFGRGWDLAATADMGTKDAAYTAGVKLGRYPNGRYVIYDVRRDRLEPEGVENLLVNTARLDREDKEAQCYRQSLPQDPGQAGKFQVQYLTSKMAGSAVDSSPETGDKSTRAASFASQVNVGNVDILFGDWNKAYIEELRSFPGSTKDQVDASSRAFAMVFQGGAALWAALGKR